MAVLGNLGKLTAPCSQMPILASNICELQGRGSSADHHRGERAVSRSAQLAACLRRVEALELPAMVRRIRWRLMNDCLALKSLCPRRASQAKSRPGVNQGPGAGSAASAPRGRRFNFADAFSSHDIKSSRAQHILFAVILFAVAMHRGLRLLAARNHLGRRRILSLLVYTRRGHSAAAVSPRPRIGNCMASNGLPDFNI